MATLPGAGDWNCAGLLKRRSPAKKPRASQPCPVLNVFISSHGYQLGPRRSVPPSPFLSSRSVPFPPSQFLHKCQGVRFEIHTTIFIQENALFFPCTLANFEKKLHIIPPSSFCSQSSPSWSRSQICFSVNGVVPGKAKRRGKDGKSTSPCFNRGCGNTEMKSSDEGGNEGQQKPNKSREQNQDVGRTGSRNTAVNQREKGFSWILIKRDQLGRSVFGVWPVNLWPESSVLPQNQREYRRWEGEERSRCPGSEGMVWYVIPALKLALKVQRGADGRVCRSCGPQVTYQR